MGLFVIPFNLTHFLESNEMDSKLAVLLSRFGELYEAIKFLKSISLVRWLVIKLAFL